MKWTEQTFCHRCPECGDSALTYEETYAEKRHAEEGVVCPSCMKDKGYHPFEGLKDGSPYDYAVRVRRLTRNSLVSLLDAVLVISNGPLKNTSLEHKSALKALRKAASMIDSASQRLLDEV